MFLISIRTIIWFRQNLWGPCYLNIPIFVLSPVPHLNRGCWLGKEAHFLRFYMPNLRIRGSREWALDIQRFCKRNGGNIFHCDWKKFLFRIGNSEEINLLSLFYYIDWVNPPFISRPILRTANCFIFLARRNLYCFIPQAFNIFVINW